MSVAAIVLAAGGSTRFGRPKQLARIRTDGPTLVRSAAEMALASRCNPVWVVVGAQQDAVERELEDLDVRSVRNADWEEGLASSIRAGVDAAAAATPRAEAVVLLLADQVRITTEIVDDLVARFERGETDLIACSYSNTLGAPALFARRFLPELEVLRGDHGARSVLAAHRSELVAVPCPAAAVDVDTEADLARLT